MVDPVLIVTILHQIIEDERINTRNQWANTMVSKNLLFVYTISIIRDKTMCFNEESDNHGTLLGQRVYLTVRLVDLIALTGYLITVSNETLDQ